MRSPTATLQRAFRLGQALHVDRFGDVTWIAASSLGAGRGVKELRARADNTGNGRPPIA
jgi:hypothetical protein